MRELPIVFVAAVAVVAFVLSRPDSFASRWAPVLSMPTEGMTVHVKLEWP